MRLTTLAGMIMIVAGNIQSSEAATGAVNFERDLALLRQHTDVVLLSDPSGQAQVAVVPQYQGRVMTSTARGPKGTSFGWINRELIASGTVVPHINVFGGEDRFWLGPEGGQFSIFFAKDAPFDLEHWFTPPSLDTEPFTLVRQSAESVLCRRTIQLTNYSGTQFVLEVDREVRLVDPRKALAKYGTAVPASVPVVGMESVNTVKNQGDKAWRKETGLLSIWILAMLNASSKTTVIIPFKTGPEAELGPVVNDTYFGKVPADRLVVKDGLLLFRGDARHRSKIGVSPRRAKPVLGSYDAEKGTLTVVEFTLPEGVTDYVNSMWELQPHPFSGDAVNSYNDGPAKPGAEQLGQFYELESSSPALALHPGDRARHVHRTFHLQGSRQQLDGIARAVFGIGLEAVDRAFLGAAQPQPKPLEP